MNDNPFEAGSAPTGSTSALGDIDPLEPFRRTFAHLQDHAGAYLPSVAPILVLGLFAFGSSMAVSLTTAGTENEVLGTLATSSLSIVLGFVQLIFFLGIIRVTLNAERGDEVHGDLLWTQTPNLGRGLVTFVLMTVLIVLGTLACIAPGLFISLTLVFALPIVVDTDMGPAEAIQSSFEMTEGYRLFLLVQLVIVVAVSIPLYCVTCGLGSILVQPYMIALQAVTYDMVLQHRAAANRQAVSGALGS